MKRFGSHALLACLAAVLTLAILSSALTSCFRIQKIDHGTETTAPETQPPETEKPAVTQPATDKPATDKPTADKPGTDKPATDNPGTGDPVTDLPGGDEAQLFASLRRLVPLSRTLEVHPGHDA